MPAQLDTVLARLEGELVVAYPQLTFGRGERDLRAYGTLPRIVWVETEDAFSPADQQHNNPRSIRTRNAGVDVHILAGTAEDAEVLANAVQVLAHRFVSYDVTAGRTEHPDYTDEGLVYVLSVTFALPVLDRLIPTASLTHYALRPGTPGDGVLESGED